MPKGLVVRAVEDGTLVANLRQSDALTWLTHVSSEVVVGSESTCRCCSFYSHVESNFVPPLVAMDAGAEGWDAVDGGEREAPRAAPGPESALSLGALLFPFHLGLQGAGTVCRVVQ